MPLNAKHPCAYPGCPELIRNGRFCEKHKTLAGREYNKYARRADYKKTYGHKWTAIRDLYIQKHPLCERCLEQGFTVPAALVHHIKPTASGGGHEETNLMSLCASCHAKIHGSL